MFTKILLTTSTIMCLSIAGTLVYAQPAPTQKPMAPGAGFGRQPAGPTYRGGIISRPNRAPFGPRFNRPAPSRLPYFGRQFAPPRHFGPRHFRPSPYWAPRYRYWFWITWYPSPWPYYVYDPSPYYYYYYPYPYYYYYDYGYTTTYRYNYQYGNQYGNPGPSNEYQQKSYDQNESQSYGQEDNFDPEQARLEYENWIVQELNLSAKQKQDFIVQLRNLQSLREDFLDKRATLTEELADMQQSGSTGSQLNKKMNQIENMDKKFQKDEQAALGKLMKSLTVEQRAKYYSMQSQFAPQQEENPQP